MTYQDLMHAGIEIQCQTILCYYDYHNDTRVPITREEAAGHEIKYMYVEDDTLYIELEVEL
ncbi:MAG: hypothetical protein IJW51_02475 [Clostridia bacterium]|nr:hypothetical protein [Clostridia bacterium]